MSDQVAKLYHSPRKESVWIEAPASERQAIAASGKAEFITALCRGHSETGSNLTT